MSRGAGTGPTRTTCVYKNGESRGFSAQMVFLKGRGIGAFLLLNTVPQNPSIGAIATDLMNSLSSSASKRRGGVRGGAPGRCPSE